MSYLLEMRQCEHVVAQEIKDEDTLWIIIAAMLNGECPVECVVSRLKDETEPSSDDEWCGKGESRHDV